MTACRCGLWLALLAAGCSDGDAPAADAALPDAVAIQNGTGFMEIDGTRYDFALFAARAETAKTTLGGAVPAMNDPVGCPDPTDESCTFVAITFTTPGDLTCAASPLLLPQLMVRLPADTYAAYSAGNCSYSVSEDASQFHVTNMAGTLYRDDGAPVTEAINLTAGELHIDKLPGAARWLDRQAVPR